MFDATGAAVEQLTYCRLRVSSVRVWGFEEFDKEA
ncbi:hypothetical protein Hoch_1061 [Haliangium ochraceum DSM 14365]|uniref:Uncharacterized protein n=1 Tax=Haliangium ochraceum (strain DSM 14365 / JCM 11303 / SMP-2) TaxID=502025 RepID=D0LQU2_HALO1|nr:hypothetical protein Hoch_1061 [Haliangium ochraceum DSM 14365]